MSASTRSQSHIPEMPLLARVGRSMTVNPALVAHMAKLDFLAQHERADYNARLGWRPDPSGQGQPAFVPEASDGRGQILNLDGTRANQSFSSLPAAQQLSEARLRLLGVITPEMFHHMMSRRRGSAHQQWADAYENILGRLKTSRGSEEISDPVKRAAFLTTLQSEISGKLQNSQSLGWLSPGRQTAYFRAIRPVFSDVSGHQRQWSHPSYQPELMTSIRNSRDAGNYDLHQFIREGEVLPRTNVRMRPSMATPYTEMESLLSFPEKEPTNPELRKKMSSALAYVATDESSAIARHPLIKEFQGTGMYPGMTKDHVSLIRVMPTLLHRMPDGSTQPHREPVFTFLPHDSRKIAAMRDFAFHGSSYHE